MLQGKPSRRLWIVAIAVSVVCVAGLAYALVTDWDTPPSKTLGNGVGHHFSATGSGFGLGLLIGVGAGVVLGSLLALRKPK